MYIEMKVGGVALDPSSKSPVVLLNDLDGRYTLPIWIGILEAASIAAVLEGVEASRPMTHDLMKQLVDELGGRVGRIDIDSLEDNVYYAKIHIQAPEGRERLIDSRPSDAIALALRVGADVFAEESVLKKSSVVEVRTAENMQDDDQENLWSDFLENLDPSAFGKYKM